METKHQVHNLIILDESGSMESIKKTIIQGFNEIVQTVKGIEKEFPEQEHFISLVTFNGFGNKILHFIDPAGKLEMIDANRYHPDSMTPLYDAMGFSFAKLRQVVENLTDYNVLVTILTDGEENASKEFTGVAIKHMIEELKLKRWTFTYIGADHDVEKFAASISITNTIHFQKNEANMKAMFAQESNSRSNYSQKIREKKDTNDDFYRNDDSKK